MVLVNELLDQPEADIDQILSSLEQDHQELKPEQIAACVKIREILQRMRVSLQPVLHLFYGLDLDSIPKLRISSQQLLQLLLLNIEEEEGVSSSKLLEFSTAAQAIIEKNNAEISAEKAESKKEIENTGELSTDQDLSKEKEEKISSSNMLELSTAGQAIIEVNNAEISAEKDESKEEIENTTELSAEQNASKEREENNITTKVHKYEYQEILLPSQVEHMETIWGWLNDESIGTISIRGSLGVGKTWIARQLKERAVSTNLFEVFIWIDRDNKDVEECQEHIVDQLQLPVMKKPNGKYYKKEDLMQKVSLSLGSKRFLLIIDGIQDDDDLHSFGFSHPQKQNKLSKVLILESTWSKKTKLMDKRLEVGCLSTDEAWLLFQGITRLDIDSSIAREIVEPLLKSFNGYLGSIAYKAEDVAELTKGVSDLVMSGRKDVLECLRFCTSLSLGTTVAVIELIPCWIVRILKNSEFDDNNKSLELEKAYEKANHILKELIDRRFLEGNEYHVWVNELLSSLKLDSFTRDSVFYEEAYEVLKEISYVMDENMQTMNSDYARENSSNTQFLLLYGKEGCLPREIPDLFFDQMQQLRTLAILHAGIISLPESITNLKKLHTLLIIDCPSLENVNQIRRLNISRLSLSGLTSLKEIPDDIFQHVRSLEHLDLSHTQLKQLPQSFSNLRYLKILILRGCTQLQSLPPMHDSSLSLLDLSDASALTSIPDTNYYLETLDMSRTLVDKVPSPSNHKFLAQLILRGCSQVKAMPHPGAFPKLRVLHLSDATAFRQFEDETSDDYTSLTKLDLSGSLIEQVPPLSGFVKLHEVLLRNCCNIKTMPPLCNGLEVLDISGSSAFKNFQDESFCVHLRKLDISRTQIEKVPTFSMHSVLVQLILKECEFLEDLPPLELQKLQVLDLSGSIKFKVFRNHSFEKLCHLRTLNLTDIQVATLPTLLHCSELRQIILRNCLNLEILPQVSTLTNLEVLDLSGAIAFKQFQDESLGKKEHFQELNLSGTQVVHIPSLSECHNLQNLILGNCSKLEMLPNLGALSTLVVLDLSRADSLMIFPHQSLKQNSSHLEVLDLSGTTASDLSFLSGCINLSHLLLRDCSNIQTLPPLNELTRLEVFDLSGTEVTEFSFISGCKSLCQLSLRGCLNLEMLSFEGMHNLKKLDLSERKMKMLPLSFSQLRNVRTLLLEDCSSLESLPCTKLITELEVLNLSCTKIRAFPNGISASTYLMFLKVPEGNSLWDFNNSKSFERFHICLFASKERIDERDIYLQGQHYSFRDIYYQTSHIPQLTEEPDKFFKICGFRTFPGGIEEVLVHVQLLYLKKNGFLTRLSDLGAENIKVMTECWIENCDSVESIFYGEEREENAALGKCLQNLWVSKLSELKSLFRGVVEPGSFPFLKHLYIECCPSLITVFSSPLELRNLEMIKIKFCDKLESIFGEMLLGEETLPNLTSLILFKLPELQSICGGVLPSLKNLRVIGCSKIKRLPVSRNTTSPHVKITGEAIWWNDLEWEDEATKSQLRFSPF